MDRLEARFHSVMLSLYDQAKGLDYFANYFKQMLDRHGGVETAKRLLIQGSAQEGLYRLWELSALELSVEATVLRDEFASLFDEREMAEAKRRLEDLGYDPGGISSS